MFADIESETFTLVGFETGHLRGNFVCAGSQERYRIFSGLRRYRLRLVACSFLDRGYFGLGDSRTLRICHLAAERTAKLLCERSCRCKQGNRSQHVNLHVPNPLIVNVPETVHVFYRTGKEIAQPVTVTCYRYNTG